MSASPATALTRLEAIVGAENAITEAEALAPYEIDGVRPRLAVRPRTAEEIAEVVRIAAAERLAVIPTGGRTHLGIGGSPSRYDIAVDVGRLNRVLSYDPGDLTLSVEAGIGIAALNETLARDDQFLPLFVPNMLQASVGGALAAGLDSPLRQYYGTARDFLLGLEFVDGTGAHVKSGSRVVKSVAGYDLHKLHLGALGTLGILTRANFRTFPSRGIFPDSRGFVASFARLDGALALRRRILESALTPLTLEILSPEIGEMFAAPVSAELEPGLTSAAPWFPRGHWTLAAATGGNSAVMERHVREFARLADEEKASNVFTLEPAERPHVWGRLREAFGLLRASCPAATILKIPALPSEFGRVIAALAEIAVRAGIPSATLVRGAGIVYFALLPGALDIERLATAVAEAFRAAANCGGHATLLWCPTELKRRIPVWGEPREDFVLMKKVKATLDPPGIFSPGRFVGGL